MKRIIIILFFTVASVVSTYSQTIKEGDNCFERGDYACAEQNYKAVLEFATDKDKDKLKAEMRLELSQQCAVYMKTADQAFENEDYKTAKINYQSVLDNNPKDAHAKSQLIKINVQNGNDCFEKGDYGCATTNYKEANALATTADNRVAIDKKLDSTQKCIGNINNADTAFKNKDYKAAKDYYQSVYKMNPKDVYAESQIEKCTRYLNPVQLSVSKKDLSFSSSGGDEKINVTTNADSYSVEGLPSWCSVDKSTKYFLISCETNLGNTERNDYFTVTAGDKKVRITVKQAGKTVTLSTSTQDVVFGVNGGEQTIVVKTNANDYQVTLIPSWCNVDKSSDAFTLKCDANYTGLARSGSLLITANEKDVRISVYQSGPSVQQTSRPKTTKCFNCPKAKYPVGISIGATGLYDERVGIQGGIRYEPLFKYGFGLHTGLFFEHYKDDEDRNLNDLDDLDDLYNYSPITNVIDVQIHLEYRLNFAKYFNMFMYGGTSLDYALKGVIDYDGDKTFVPYIDVGAGLRINHVQFNFKVSTGFEDAGNAFSLDYAKKVELSMSYMF
jgi:tetratricopeptide (TPR) repeat protein